MTSRVANLRETPVRRGLADAGELFVPGALTVVVSTDARRGVIVSHARRCFICRRSPTVAPLRVVHDVLRRSLPRHTRPLPSARRSEVGAAERFEGGYRTTGDELGRSREVGAPPMSHAGRDEVVDRETRRQAGDLRLGSGRALDAHRPARHADARARPVALRAELAGVECPHLVGSSCGSCRRGDVGDHATVHEQVAAPGLGSGLPWQGVVFAYGLSQLATSVPFTPGGAASSRQAWPASTCARGEDSTAPEAGTRSGIGGSQVSTGLLAPLPPAVGVTLG